MTVIGPSTGKYVPTNPIFSYTDHAGVTVDATKARFLRPIDFQNRQYYTPGARVRLRSDADEVTLLFHFNDLYDRTHWNSIFSVYVDGAWHSDHDAGPSREEFDYSIPLDFGSSDFRTIEAVFPYIAAVDFVGVQQDPRYRLAPCQPRPTKRYLAIGDSITNAFYGTQTRNGFAFLLAEAKKAECVNMGYANAEVSTHGDGSYVASMGDFDFITTLLGVNDCASQVALVTFKANYTALLNGLLAETSAEIYVITPTWTTITGTITMSSYRTAIEEVVSAIADARLHLVDGLTLATNSTAHFPDQVHPNDAGHAAIAANLAALIT